MSDKYGFREGRDLLKHHLSISLGLGALVVRQRAVARSRARFRGVRIKDYFLNGVVSCNAHDKRGALGFGL